MSFPGGDSQRFDESGGKTQAIDEEVAPPERTHDNTSIQKPWGTPEDMTNLTVRQECALCKRYIDKTEPSFTINPEQAGAQPAALAQQQLVRDGSQEIGTARNRA